MKDTNHLRILANSVTLLLFAACLWISFISAPRGVMLLFLFLSNVAALEVFQEALLRCCTSLQYLPEADEPVPHLQMLEQRYHDHHCIIRLFGSGVVDCSHGMVCLMILILQEIKINIGCAFSTILKWYLSKMVLLLPVTPSMIWQKIQHGKFCLRVILIM